MGKFGTGQAIRRKEDQRFLTGTGRYTDDITLPDQAYLYVFRSPYPHGAITTLDIDDAKRSPGVIAVYTAADLANAGINDVVGAAMPGSSLSAANAALEQPPLARDRVRYVGEPVAAVVAESIAAAKDAAELIWLDVDELDAVVTIESAMSDGAITIHDSAPGNSYGFLEYGNRAKTEDLFAAAAHVVAIDVVNNRLAPTAMEPRGCNIQWDGDTLTVYQGCQSVHVLRDRLAKSVNLDTDSIHFISPDVGGAFGLKFFLQCETVVTAFAAMDLGRPVKWIADRNESFLSDLHGRDHLSHAEFALDADGRN
ncbi:MAG: molybdopterin-dependent oxidoreductase, partial [Gammaproteobacteria bacterium]|nr:molybdopterin-dependent oxidoreductase [Gammaproteobacteria bacterium]